MSKKLYFIRKEVYATCISKAISTKGRIVTVEEAPDSVQPEEGENKKIGFKKKKNENQIIRRMV
jgi:hypothetical protein